jgi:hypothetical protein
MKNGTKSQELSLEQIGTLAGFITGFLVKILSIGQVLYFLGHKTELKQKLYQAFEVSDNHTAIRAEWQNFWKDQFGWNVDFSMVIIPPKPEIGSWRLLIIPKGMTNNKMFARMGQLFKCWKYMDNLDVAVPPKKNARTTENHYAVWVHDGAEPDEEFLGKSVREVDSDMKIGMTLLERMTLELKYFVETGKHLDIKGGTRCSGSRYSGGGVPDVSWNPNDGTVFVYWSNVGSASGGWGFRRAVYS